MHFFGTFFAFVAMLVCMSTASPVLAPTHMIYPRMAMEPIVNADSLTVGTFVIVPLGAANGLATKLERKQMSHPAVILDPPFEQGPYKGLYPIAYISHDPTHTAIVRLTPEIPGVGEQINLKPGWKSRAAMSNMYRAKMVAANAKATPAQVDEMREIWAMRPPQ
ncbi:hypothetical protein BDP27DRAFT_1415242 [Rhodocollybia butyracea]|uniref:Uncharacterized protein n=1 Tax=Rhodocollybia butyracea TaxID=206335 RepID=A0A9P5UDR2_9AGAR|nr:hypothetical protein BDP27DRAFT_1415242 [Rhodocollybia butyracea]